MTTRSKGGHTCTAACREEPVSATVPDGRVAVAEVIELEVTGMGCSGCATRVRNGLIEIDGVLSADVDLASARATVRHAPGLPPEILTDAVICAGAHSGHRYRARPVRHVA